MVCFRQDLPQKNRRQLVSACMDGHEALHATVFDIFFIIQRYLIFFLIIHVEESVSIMTEVMKEYV